MFLSSLKKYDKAIIAINNCLRITPNAHDIYLTGGILYENLGDTISSKTYFQKSLTICNIVLDTMNTKNRDYVMFTTNKAINLIMLGDSIRANKLLKYLYDTQPDDPEYNNVEKKYIQSLMNRNKTQLMDLSSNQ
jgi:tetratricopeptide (TPR) repeat protein